MPAARVMFDVRRFGIPTICSSHADVMDAVAEAERMNQIHHTCHFAVFDDLGDPVWTAAHAWMGLPPSV